MGLGLKSSIDLGRAAFFDAAATVSSSSSSSSAAAGLAAVDFKAPPRDDRLSPKALFPCLALLRYIPPPIKNNKIETVAKLQPIQLTGPRNALAASAYC